MKILSIDQSYTCSGIVLLTDGNVTHCEVFKTEKPEDKKDMNATYRRAFLVSERIKHLAKKYEPDLISIEGLAFGMRGNATRDLAGLQFVIIVDLLIRLKYDIEVVSPLSVKKFATGSGKAKKIEMIESLPEDTLNKFKKLGVKKTTGLADLADAYWIGLTAESIRKNKETEEPSK